MAFWTFVVLTALRQVHYLWHQSIQKKLHISSHFLRKEDQLGSQLLYVVYVIIWFGAIYELYTDELSWPWYLTGLSLLVIGFIIRVIALRDLGKSYGHEIVIWQNHKLITYGIYAWIRHPLYLALAIELLGMVLVGREIWLLVAWLLLIAILIRRISLEDKMLEETFGEAAKEYQASVSVLNFFSRLIRHKS